MTTATKSHEGGWEHDRVSDVAIQCLPPGEGTLGTVVVLSDADWPDSGMWRLLGDLLRGSKLAAVVPEIRPWWIDRADPALTPARSPLSFVVDELAPWITANWPGQARLAVFGVGFGGQGALQLAYRQPQLFPIAAAINPAIDFHRLCDSSPQLREWFETQEQARQETATLRIHPLNWPPHQWFACPRGDWRFDGCERLASKLTSIGIPFEADLETPDGPSDFDRQLQSALGFIAKRLAEPPMSRGVQIRG
jgi:hypothetical protein